MSMSSAYHNRNKYHTVRNFFSALSKRKSIEPKKQNTVEEDPMHDVTA